MANIPVFRVWGGTIRASLLQFPTAFRLAWFPFVIYDMVRIAKNLAVNQVLAANAAGEWTPLFGAHLDPIAIALAGLDPAWFLLLWLIAISSAWVAWLQWAMHGDARDGHYFNFRWGGAETRVLIATILMSIAMIAVILVVAMAVRAVTPKLDLDMLDAATVTFGGQTMIPGSALMQVSLAAKAAALIGAATIIWFALRLSLVLPAMADRGALAFGSAWVLSGGQVIRLFLLHLLTTVYALIVVLAFGIFIGSLIGPFSVNSDVRQAEPHPADHIAGAHTHHLVAGAMRAMTGVESVALAADISVRPDSTTSVRTVTDRSNDLNQVVAVRADDVTARHVSRIAQPRELSVLGPLLNVFLFCAFAWMSGRAYTYRTRGSE